jgi:hypothetical protein
VSGSSLNKCNLSGFEKRSGGQSVYITFV